MAAPAPTGFYVVHDVENIAGLHLALNAISEGMERRLFERNRGPAATQQLGQEIFQLANAVRDCGLLPDMQTPDWVQLEPCSAGVPAPQDAEMDPPGGSGETCVVVITGASCVLSLYPPPARGLEPVEVLLPRRSICVLSEDARYATSLGGVSSGWQHAFGGAGAGDEGPRPKWNPGGQCHRIEMRSSMDWAVLLLQRQLRCVQQERDKLPQGAARSEWERQAKGLKARVERLQRRRDAGRREEFSKAEMLERRRQVAQRADAILGSQLEAARLPAAKAPFWHELPPHIAALYPGPPPPAPPPAPGAAAAVASEGNAAAAGPTSSEHSPASQATQPLSMHCRQLGQSAAAEEGEVLQPVRSPLPLPGTPAAKAVRR